MRRTWSLVIVLASSATAAGDPEFVVLDHQSQVSEGGVEISDIVESNNFHALRFEPHAQYIDPASGLGGYAQLPAGWAWGDCMFCASESAVGDLDLGALYARDVKQGLAIVAHAGIALPTSSFDQFVLPSVTASRIEDLALEIPHGTTLRFGASPILRMGRVFGRVDLGLDVNVSNRFPAGGGPRFVPTGPDRPFWLGRRRRRLGGHGHWRDGRRTCR
jgi:hypothetical protein